jgi:arsenite methyltransferase
MQPKVDARELRSKVKQMYHDVATNPRGSFHFETGRALAERLGYAASDLDWVPAEALESFAGVGHFFHFAALQAGEIVIDLGSGAGTDSFIAALKVGSHGRVLGIDMTPEQLAKAERLRRRHDFRNLAYLDGYIEETGLEPDTADCVISNGETLKRAGFVVRELQENREYRFLSDGAQAATRQFGVKSVSILAVKSG